MTVLLDTNIILEHLRTGVLINTPEDVDFAVSVITVAECLRLPGIGTEERIQIDQLFGIIKTIEIDYSIAQKAAILGRTRKTKLPDLLIAATAIEFNIPLITKNIKDFKNIPDLEARTEI